MPEECLSPERKKVIVSILEKSTISRDHFQEILEKLREVPTCGEESTVIKPKKERKRSEYQQYISECMRKYKSEYAGKPFGAAGTVMKKCAEEWKRKKAANEQSN